jgi:hypothetical protein
VLAAVDCPVAGREEFVVVTVALESARMGPRVFEPFVEVFLSFEIDIRENKPFFSSFGVDKDGDRSGGRALLLGVVTGDAIGTGVAEALAVGETDGADEPFCVAAASGAATATATGAGACAGTGAGAGAVSF